MTTGIHFIYTTENCSLLSVTEAEIYIVLHTAVFVAINDETQPLKIHILGNSREHKMKPAVSYSSLTCKHLVEISLR